MHGANPASSLDTVLLMAPFAIFMILAMFGLDERLASKSGRHARRPRFCEVGPSGEGRLSDPDGRPANRARFPRIFSGRKERSVHHHVPTPAKDRSMRAVRRTIYL